MDQFNLVEQVENKGPVQNLSAESDVEMDLSLLTEEVGRDTEMGQSPHTESSARLTT